MLKASTLMVILNSIETVRTLWPETVQREDAEKHLAMLTDYQFGQLSRALDQLKLNGRLLRQEMNQQRFEVSFDE